MFRHKMAAAVAIGVASMGVASATPVPTYSGDPFPSGIEVVYSGGPFVLPLVGTFDSASLSGFNLLNIGTPGGPNQTFDYSVTFTVPFTNPASTGIFAGTVEVEVVGRSSLAQTGTFPLVTLAATSSTSVINGQVVARLGGAPFTTTTRSVTYSAGGPSGLLVSSVGTDIPIGFTVNNGPFISTPMGYASQPALSAVPLPAALPLFGAGLGMMGWLARRRKAAAAPVAA
jgi:hypothetical protein